MHHFLTNWFKKIKKTQVQDHYRQNELSQFREVLPFELRVAHPQFACVRIQPFISSNKGGKKKGKRDIEYINKNKG